MPEFGTGTTQDTTASVEQSTASTGQSADQSQTPPESIGLIVLGVVAVVGMALGVCLRLKAPLAEIEAGKNDDRKDRRLKASGSERLSTSAKDSNFDEDGEARTDEPKPSPARCRVEADESNSGCR